MRLPRQGKAANRNPNAGTNCPANQTPTAQCTAPTTGRGRNACTGQFAGSTAVHGQLKFPAVIPTGERRNQARNCPFQRRRSRRHAPSAGAPHHRHRRGHSCPKRRQCNGRNVLRGGVETGRPGTRLRPHPSESYFTAASDDFNRGDTVSGAENLCHAANCVVIGQPALHGWPHATDDDINVVVALATGTLPQNADETYNLLQQASSDGQYLSSNHGAVKSVRQAARLGYFVEHG